MSAKSFYGLLNPYITFPAPLPDLPTRRPDDAEDPIGIARAAVSTQDDQGVILAGTTRTDEPLRVTVRIVAPGSARVLLEAEDSDPRRWTLARLPAEAAVPVTIRQAEGSVTLDAEGISVRIELDPFRIVFSGPDGHPRLAQNPTDTIVTDRLNVLPLGFSRVDGQRAAFHDTFTVEPDEHFYGFGEKFTDLDKRGQRLEMWAYDAFGAHGERAYKNVPFFLSSRGYGIFVDSTTAIRFDMAASNHAVFSMIVPDSALDYYVIMGPALKTIITRYASLVSFPILPPKWSLGLWMSSGFFEDNQDSILRHAAHLREAGVPCDVLHLDCYWQRMGCWSDMIWDRKTYPHPEQLIETLRADGYKFCVWMNPYIGVESERFAEGVEKGYFLKTPQGDPWVGDVWSGGHPPVGIIDMTNPAALEWFQASLRPLLRLGIDAFKTDFGEAIPAETLAWNGMTGAQLHNLYPLLYNDAVAQVTEEETGHSGLVWGRSTYAGGQRHAAQWGGDPNCTYQALASTLRAGLSFGLSGHPFWGHDLGGFHARPTPDLYARWAQFGLFSPMSRSHGMSSRLPWDYGEEFLAIYRQYVNLRYHLLPYLYTYASLAAETSLPIIRAMVLEFPDDPNTYTMDLQYMFGEEILVAPIYNVEGKRPVYFPVGRWVDYWTHEVIEGPQTRFVSAPLETLPLYVRANALIPTMEPTPFLGAGLFEFVTFDGYLLDGGAGAFELRDTDGRTQVAARLDGTRLALTVSGTAKRLAFRLLPLAGRPALSAVSLNGAELPAAQWSTAPDGTVTITPE